MKRLPRSLEFVILMAIRNSKLAIKPTETTIHFDGQVAWLQKSIDG